MSLVTLPTERLAPHTSRIARHPVRVHAAVIAVAAVLWLVSLPLIDPSELSDIGLISVLPPTYFVGLGLLAAGFAWAFTASYRRGVLPAYVLALAVFLHGLAPALYSVPKYAYVYKHIAVIDFIAGAGAVYRNIDIYHNWPGFFAACASLSTVLGVDPASYANLALPFFMIGNLLAVRFVARGLTSDPRRVAATMWLFLLGAWLAPTYLAPQSLAYLMALTVFGLVLRCFPRQRSLYLPDSSLDRSAVPDLSFPRPVAALVLVALAGAIVVSHQLTPFFLVVGLLVMRYGRLAGSWWLPAVVLLMTAAQIAVSYRYVSTHQALFSFDILQNAQGAQIRSPGAGSAGHQLVATVARGLSAALLLLGLLGWWRVGRRSGENWVLVLALIPGSLLLVQGYGGEGIYRVYVFMCLWLAFLGAGLLAAARPERGWARYALAAGSVVAVLAMITATFGQERSDRITPQEVAAATWFETATPSGSIITYLTNNYPSPITARYSQHFTGDGKWGGEVTGDERFAQRELTAQDVPAVAQSLAELADPGQPVYLALGPSQEAYASSYGYAPPGAVTRFGWLLVQDRTHFRVVYRDQDAYILQVLPEGTPTS